MNIWYDGKDLKPLEEKETRILEDEKEPTCYDSGDEHVNCLKESESSIGSSPAQL